jgi:hypothetical protein
VDLRCSRGIRVEAIPVDYRRLPVDLGNERVTGFRCSLPASAGQTVSRLLLRHGGRRAERIVMGPEFASSAGPRLHARCRRDQQCQDDLHDRIHGACSQRLAGDQPAVRCSGRDSTTLTNDQPVSLARLATQLSTPRAATATLGAYPAVMAATGSSWMLAVVSRSFQDSLVMKYLARGCRRTSRPSIGRRAAPSCAGGGSPRSAGRLPRRCV